MILITNRRSPITYTYKCHRISGGWLIVISKLSDKWSAPIQQLLDEHVTLREEMNSFYEIAEEIEYESGSEVLHLFSKLTDCMIDFTDKLKKHSKREDDGLFPMMTMHLGKNDKTIEVMEFEHDKAERHLEDFLTEAMRGAGNLDEEDAQSITVYAVQAYTTLIQHFAKEEKVLFPLAENLLSIEEKEELALLFQNL